MNIYFIHCRRFEISLPQYKVKCEILPHFQVSNEYEISLEMKIKKNIFMSFWLILWGNYNKESKNYVLKSFKGKDNENV